MITLYQTKPLFGLPNSSPFCMKLEAFLRWHSIEFEIKEGLPFQGPFKKIPFVDYNDERLGDSTSIIETLLKDKSIQYEESLELDVGHAMQRVVEEHLYWAMVYFRWMDPKKWPTIREAFFGSIPFFVRPFIVRSAFKLAQQALYGHGIGRLTDDMILERARKDLCAIDLRVSKHSFICGQQMTHYDLSVWAVLKTDFALRFSDSNYGRCRRV